MNKNKKQVLGIAIAGILIMTSFVVLGESQTSQGLNASAFVSSSGQTYNSSTNATIYGMGLLLTYLHPNANYSSISVSSISNINNTTYQKISSQGAVVVNNTSYDFVFVETSENFTDYNLVQSFLNLSHTYPQYMTSQVVTSTSTTSDYVQNKTTYQIALSSKTSIVNDFTNSTVKNSFGKINETIYTTVIYYPPLDGHIRLPKTYTSYSYSNSTNNDYSNVSVLVDGLNASVNYTYNFGTFFGSGNSYISDPPTNNTNGTNSTDFVVTMATNNGTAYSNNGSLIAYTIEITNGNGTLQTKNDPVNLSFDPVVYYKNIQYGRAALAVNTVQWGNLNIYTALALVGAFVYQGTEIDISAILAALGSSLAAALFAAADIIVAAVGIETVIVAMEMPEPNGMHEIYVEIGGDLQFNWWPFYFDFGAYGECGAIGGNPELYWPTASTLEFTNWMVMIPHNDVWNPNADPPWTL